MSWDPREQECLSYYGYGIGFFMAEEHARAKAANYAPDESSMFCNTCPVRQDCWEKLQERVREERPEAAAKWDTIVERNRAQGIDNGRIAAQLAAAGRPDPWMRDMLANIRHGQEAAEGLAA